MNNPPSENSEEQFVQLFARNERHIRAFVRSMGLDWSAVDDVVQTVSLVMWRKWGQFDVTTDFMKWARVIARFEVLKFRRKMARDRHVFQEDLIALLADASEEVHSRQADSVYTESLQACLEKLPGKSHRLVQAVYHEEKSIKQVAEEIGKSSTALYKALDRIRNQLQSCIESRLAPTQ